MKKYLLAFSTSFLLTFQNSAQSTFTSVASGAWEACATWGSCDGSGDNTAGDGYPSRTDFVVIAGFQVTVNATNDNGSAQVRPRNLGINGVCGCTAGCVNTPEGCNIDAFYHTRKITIYSGGTLLSTVPMVIGDTLRINSGGTYILDDNADDTFVIGFVNVKDGGYFRTNDHLIVSGNGIVTVASTGTMIIGDDLFLDGDNSFLCGAGTFSLEDVNTNSNQSFGLFNSSDGEAFDQICAETTIICEDANCCGGGCSGDIATYADAGSGGIITPGEGGGGNNRPSTEVTLPVELTNFSGNIDNGAVKLFWQTASELNNDYFIIEKSYDGLVFYNIGEVSGNGSSQEVSEYSYIDFQLSADVIYYRLTQVDFDGTATSSFAIRLSLIETSKTTLFYNPQNETVNIQLGSILFGGVVKAEIFELSGRLVEKLELQSQNRRQTFSPNLQKGIYFIRLENSVTQEHYRIIIP